MGKKRSRVKTKTSGKGSASRLTEAVDGGRPQEILIGRERAVVVPLETWRLAMEELEELYDLRAYDRAKAEMDGSGEEFIEHDEVCRLLNRSPLRYLRSRADLTQSALAKRSGYSQSYIARAEKGQRRLSPTAARKISKVLGVPIEKLLV